MDDRDGVASACATRESPRQGHLCDTGELFGNIAACFENWHHNAILTRLFATGDTRIQNMIRWFVKVVRLRGCNGVCTTGSRVGNATCRCMVIGRHVDQGNANMTVKVNHQCIEPSQRHLRLQQLSEQPLLDPIGVTSFATHVQCIVLQCHVTFRHNVGNLDTVDFSPFVNLKKLSLSGIVKFDRAKGLPNGLTRLHMRSDTNFCDTDGLPPSLIHIECDRWAVRVQDNVDLDKVFPNLLTIETRNMHSHQDRDTGKCWLTIPSSVTKLIARHTSVETGKRLRWPPNIKHIGVCVNLFEREAAPPSLTSCSWGMDESYFESPFLARFSSVYFKINAGLSRRFGEVMSDMHSLREARLKVFEEFAGEFTIHVSPPSNLERLRIAAVRRRGKKDGSMVNVTFTSVSAALRKLHITSSEEILLNGLEKYGQNMIVKVTQSDGYSTSWVSIDKHSLSESVQIRSRRRWNTWIDPRTGMRKSQCLH